MHAAISSADPDPRHLRAHDPAELIAEARLCLGLIPRDSLVLFGHDGRRTSPLVTRSVRRQLLAPEERGHLENHLELMRRRGCRGAFALILIGDGDRKSTRLNSSHVAISYAVFCLKKKKTQTQH